MGECEGGAIAWGGRAAGSGGVGVFGGGEAACGGGDAEEADEEEGEGSGGRGAFGVFDGCVPGLSFEEEGMAEVAVVMEPEAEGADEEGERGEVEEDGACGVGPGDEGDEGECGHEEGVGDGDPTAPVFADDVDVFKAEVGGEACEEEEEEEREETLERPAG